jgi:16S rRNA (guanine1516-N2)-methyltransferase
MIRPTIYDFWKIATLYPQYHIPEVCFFMQTASNIIAVAAESDAQRGAAEILAGRLHLPLGDPALPRFPFLLVVTEARLELRQTAAGSAGPVAVDFTTGALDYRRRHGGGRSQAIARAVGLKKNARPLVFDATAGFGRDGFVLASLGCTVHLFERSPVICALLEDGLIRGRRDPEISRLVRDRLTLTCGDSNELLRQLAEERPEVVYLDPMFPSRRKSALVKKEMRILQALVGPDPDAPLLLEAALNCARHRVVVKRPRSVPPLESSEPSLKIESRKNRFDVYLTANR